MTLPEKCVTNFEEAFIAKVCQPEPSQGADGHCARPVQALQEERDHVLQVEDRELLQPWCRRTEGPHVPLAAFQRTN